MHSVGICVCNTLVMPSLSSLWNR